MTSAGRIATYVLSAGAGGCGGWSTSDGPGGGVVSGGASTLFSVTRPCSREGGAAAPCVTGTLGPIDEQVDIDNTATAAR
jgi:hypothetical protein